MQTRWRYPTVSLGDRWSVEVTTLVPSIVLEKFRELHWEHFISWFKSFVSSTGNILLLGNFCFFEPSDFVCNRRRTAVASLVYVQKDDLDRQPLELGKRTFGAPHARG
jgi:hypothetical protein